ncbi:hypothetical protein SteCoe_22580 [Stentor coeruleus]|uniref:Uncharacterized protein n=1 Tax=Stentor coeruleus TaxID=5963 RepID=A0A1R2BLP2_9CILI|nr:hypothetical protein SteCoe_22580 [Stentor coeruleus]
MSDQSENLNQLETSIQKLKFISHRIKFSPRLLDNKPEAELLLSNYIDLEDKILESLQGLSISEIHNEKLKELDKLIDTFNEYSTDFQDTWNDDLWQFYEHLRIVKSKNYYSFLASTVSSATITIHPIHKNGQELPSEFSQVDRVRVQKDQFSNSCCKCVII